MCRPRTALMRPNHMRAFIQLRVRAMDALRLAVGAVTQLIPSWWQFLSANQAVSVVGFKHDVFKNDLFHNDVLFFAIGGSEWMLEDIVTPTMKDSVHEVFLVNSMLFNC